MMATIFDETALFSESESLRRANATDKQEVNRRVRGAHHLFSIGPRPAPTGIIDSGMIAQAIRTHGTLLRIGDFITLVLGGA